VASLLAFTPPLGVKASARGPLPDLPQVFCAQPAPPLALRVAAPPP
jgi:hypothetical protein